MAKGGFRGGMPGSQANMMRQAQKMQQGSEDAAGIHENAAGAGVYGL